MRKVFHGKYVSGVIFKGISNNWVTDISYFGVKSFPSEKEAMQHMLDCGVFQN